MRKVLRRAGGEYKPTVFLFSDTQIKDEGFVEDINNILNSGEVPNMFPADERMQVRVYMYRLLISDTDGSPEGYILRPQHIQAINIFRHHLMLFSLMSYDPHC